MSTRVLFHDEIEETTGVGVSDCLSEQVLARWWRLEAFMKAANLLHRVMHAVLYRCIAMAIEMASKVGSLCIIVLLIVALAAAGVIRSE